MTEENWTLQVSLKTPSQALINVRGNNHEDIELGLRAVRDAASSLVATEQLLSGAAVAAPVITVSDAAVGQQAAALPAAPEPAFTPPAPATPTGSNCPHGPMVWRTGVSQKTGRAWGAYFCPAQKGDPSQCSPKFDDSYGK